MLEVREDSQRTETWGKTWRPWRRQLSAKGAKTCHWHPVETAMELFLGVHGEEKRSADRSKNYTQAVPPHLRVWQQATKIRAYSHIRCPMFLPWLQCPSWLYFTNSKADPGHINKWPDEPGHSPQKTSCTDIRVSWLSFILKVKPLGHHREHGTLPQRSGAETEAPSHFTVSLGLD